QIKFITGDRDTMSPKYDMPKKSDMRSYDTYDTMFLQRVEIRQLQGTNDTLLRKYDFGYHVLTQTDSWSEGSRTYDSLVLDYITTTGGNGTNTLVAPKLSFTYTNKPNRGSNPQYPYPRMTGLDNGTDGMVTLDYAKDQPVSGRDGSDALY